ncbi:MAG: polysaccharide biosynthesis C-terminal domain-containing protein [Clostridia bacterium]|nr:polysaccharide biosynthesis C-terminal domain-containing protein [Clostridia bacterium]
MSELDFHSENRLIRRSSYRYIFPPMLGMLFSQIAPVVDSVCVSGAMGEEALSAIGITGPLDYVFNIICALGGIGCGVIISRCSGAGEKGKASRVFTRTLILLSVVSLILTAACIIFIDPLLHLLSATPENFDLAKEYLIVTMAGSIFMVMNFAGDYILANDNNEKLAMAGDIAGAVVNIIVDFVGVYVFHWGIWIVALGTVLGSVVCFLIYLLHFRKKDRLCCIVRPERREGDPSLWEILKPGTAEAIMYLFCAVQLAIQNFVLREGGGTSGLGNSAIMENLELIFTIFIAGCTDAIYPMASAYHGEQNRSSMLISKRSLTKTGFIMIGVPVLLLCIFPKLAWLPYKIDDPLMLQTLPFAVRLVSICQLFIFIDTMLIDYLSATAQEGKANLAFVVQFAVQIPLILLLSQWSDMNAPWYASLAAQAAVLIYLCFFCGNLTRGMRRFHRENLLLLKGGRLTVSFVDAFESSAAQTLSGEQLDTLKQKMTDPLRNTLTETFTPESCFTILQRDDGNPAAILHYQSKKDLLEDLPELPEEEDEDDEDVLEEVPRDTCLRSEFLGMRRLMIILSGSRDEAAAKENT